MKSKRSKKQPGSPKYSRALIIAVSALVVTVGAFFLLRYISELQYEQKILKEDVTFARMETFVNLAKIRLDQELPEGNWNIEKYCDTPNSKETLQGYSCIYSVISEVSSMEEKTREIMYKITNNHNIDEYENQQLSVLKINIQAPLDQRCTISWAQRSNTTSLDCVEFSLKRRYPLKDL